jgi:hypothetical protein
MMRIAIFLLFLNSVSLTEGQQEILYPEGPCVLPSYPKLAERAWVTGSFEVEVHTLQGSVSKVKYLSRQITSPTIGTITNEDPMSHHFENSIEEAVKKWKFRNLQPDSFRMTVEFRLVDTIYDPERREHTIYQVNEVPFRPPNRITIEAHRQGIKF